MVETHGLFSSTRSLSVIAGLIDCLAVDLTGPPLSRISNVYGERTNLGSKYDQMYSKVAKKNCCKSNRKAMNSNGSNQRPKYRS